MNADKQCVICVHLRSSAAICFLRSLDGCGPCRVQIGRNEIVMAFRGVDYFCVDSLFSEEELMVRQTARRFAEERILPLIRDCYRDGRFPAEIVPEMAELGFLGANLEGYGCAGAAAAEFE